MAIPFQTAFGKHRSCDLIFGEDEVSLTQQSMQDECDINLIMARYEKIGIIEHLNSSSQSYGDFLSASDYQTSLNEVMAAQDAFDSLPSSIRTRFENDPSAFLDFVHDENNRDEMISMGLIEVPIENVNSVQLDQNLSSSTSET